jgi:hypothetical protein
MSDFSLIVLAAILMGSTTAKSEDVPTPGKVLAKTAKTYSECKSYSDSGVSTLTATENDGRKRKTRTQFRTSYVKGKEFRFAYRQNVNNYGYGGSNVLLYDGEVAKVKMEGGDDFERQKSLIEGIASLTGVSFGTAHTIPALLMPDRISGHNVLRLTGHSSLVEEGFAMNPCYKIKGLVHETKVILWIDKHTGLLIKTEENYQSNAIDYMVTTVFIPSVDVEIPESFFEEHVVDKWDELGDKKGVGDGLKKGGGGIRCQE